MKKRTFCMKKRAGLLRHNNLDIENMMQFACMHIVVANVSIVYRLPISAILDRRRGRRKVSDARQLCQYLCHISFQHSFAKIGKTFNRDRTSVAHACRRIEDQRDIEHYDMAIEFLGVGVMSLAKSLYVVKDEEK